MSLVMTARPVQTDEAVRKESVGSDFLVLVARPQMVEAQMVEEMRPREVARAANQRFQTAALREAKRAEPEA